MTTKLSREELKKLSAEEKIAYQQAMNRERVAKYREANKEKADKYNREYKKDYINRPENKEKYKKLNKINVANYNKRKKEILKTFEIMKANKNSEKLTENAKKAKETEKEGQRIMNRIIKINKELLNKMS